MERSSSDRRCVRSRKTYSRIYRINERQTNRSGVVVIVSNTAQAPSRALRPSSDVPECVAIVVVECCAILGQINVETVAVCGSRGTPIPWPPQALLIFQLRRESAVAIVAMSALRSGFGSLKSQRPLLTNECPSPIVIIISQRGCFRRGVRKRDFTPRILVARNN